MNVQCLRKELKEATLEYLRIVSVGGMTTEEYIVQQKKAYERVKALRRKWEIARRAPAK